MPGKNYLKASSILLCISAICSIIVFTIMGLILGRGTVESGEQKGWLVVAVFALYTIAAVIQLVAAVKGIRGCDDRSAAPGQLRLGIIVLVISVIAAGAQCYSKALSGGTMVSAVISLLLSLLLPAVYAYGAILNGRA